MSRLTNGLRMVRVRERAHGWMTDNVRPRFECEDLTLAVKTPYPKKRAWLTSDDVKNMKPKEVR